MRIAQETGRKALEEARNEALKELEEERSEREAEREAAATERTDIVRVHAEKLQTLKDAHSEAMRVAAQEAARSLARIREVDERAVNTEMALARETRD